METAVTAYAAAVANGSLARTTVPRRPVGEHDVLVEIAYCGICHSDIHVVRGEWGGAVFPIVPGHEITGLVTESGRAVTKHSVGDRVAVGAFVDSCRTCASCRAGEEQYCLAGETPTYGGIGADGQATYGGYSTHIVVDENYVLRVPDGLELAPTAPLLCAGITMYSSLSRWDASAGIRLAIIGMGGLGHIGVKLARAMGAEITVLSHSMRKKSDALRLGAHHYRCTEDTFTFTQLAGSFDLIINTASASMDLDAYLSLLKVGGTFVVVGLPDRPTSFQAYSLVKARRCLAASKMGGIRETQEMLEYCARQALCAEIEIISADQINRAYERVVAADVRYRFVIDVASLSR